MYYFYSMGIDAKNEKFIPYSLNGQDTPDPCLLRDNFINELMRRKNESYGFIDENNQSKLSYNLVRSLMGWWRDECSMKHLLWGVPYLTRGAQSDSFLKCTDCSWRSSKDFSMNIILSTSSDCWKFSLEIAERCS